jgi:hypothetical protein
MDTWEDYARDEFISSLYQDFAKDVLAGRDELYGEVINQFTLERLQSYSAQRSRSVAGALDNLGCSVRHTRPVNRQLHVTRSSGG